MLKNKKTKIYLLSTLVICGLLVFGFQNCSDTKLYMSVKPIALADSNLCTRAADLYSGQLKVLFVVDMSFSNIGDAAQNPLQNGTDYAGIRFDKINEFLDGCGSININNKFSVLGFSGRSLKSVLYPSGSCAQPFGDKTTAKATVAQLRQIQTTQIGQPTGPVFTMQNTTYLDGLSCAQESVKADINANPPAALNTTYLVFYITDGKPTDNCNTQILSAVDSYGNCLPSAPQSTTSSPYVFNAGYETNLVDMMTIGKTKASNIRFQPVYYGPANQELAARNILDFFAFLGDSKSTILIQNAANLDFCKFANEPVNTNFHMSEFNAINLTAVMRSGQLWPDSDIDGLIDSEDPNPTNARSNPAGLLDGICAMDGGPSYCTRPTGCSLSTFSRTHLTQCDAVAAQLSDGVDDDHDRIPDIVELLRGTDPIIDDANDNLDNDSSTNIVELHYGRQVDFADDNVPGSYLTKWTKSIQQPTSSCPANQENWKFSLNQVPLVNTKAYTDPADSLFPGSKFSLSHAAGENVIFVYYFVEPTNASPSSVPAELWGTIVRVSPGSASPSLKSSDFQKLGLVNGVFQ